MSPSVTLTVTVPCSRRGFIASDHWPEVRLCLKSFKAAPDYVHLERLCNCCQPLATGDFRSTRKWLLPLQGACPGLLLLAVLTAVHPQVGAFLHCSLALPPQERIAQARIASNDEATTSSAHRSRVPVDRSVSTAAEFGQTADRAVIPVVRHQHLSLVDASHHSSVTDLQWLPGMAITGKGRPPTAKVRCTQAAADAGLLPTRNAEPADGTRMLALCSKPWSVGITHSSLRTWQRCVRYSCSRPQTHQTFSCRGGL